MTDTFLPPLTPPDQLMPHMLGRGYAVLGASAVATLAGVDLAALRALEPDWADLPPDLYLKDGGRYRRRRHACFVVDQAQATRTPDRAHWQPVEYNALHGGMERWFAPMLDASTQQAAWLKLLAWLGQVASDLKGAPPQQPWFLEAHQFRIDTTDGIGRPTPEGAHRDGVDLVAVFLIGRTGIKGGETRVFEAAGPNGQRFTLTEPWSLLLLDDARVIHESTPIQPVDTSPEREQGAHRDTLVVTCRAQGFQGDGVV